MNFIYLSVVVLAQLAVAFVLVLPAYEVLVSNKKVSKHVSNIAFLMSAMAVAGLVTLIFALGNNDTTMMYTSFLWPVGAMVGGMELDHNDEFQAIVDHNAKI